jgi:O-antigen/teichoic acid export membrane protein
VQYRKLQDLITFGMVLPFTAATFAALPLYTYLFNRQVAGILLLPTALLSLGFFMGATVNVPYTFSVAIGKPNIASRTNVLALFVVIPVMSALIYFFGLIGAASSWAAYNLFVYAYMIPRICRECLGISTWTWFTQILKVAALGAVTYGSAWLLLVIPHSYSTLALAAGYVLASAAFLAGSLLLMGPDLRTTICRLPQQLVAGRVGTPQ